jgi:hypothetical protein
MFAGFGGILLGNNDNGQSFSQNFTITDNTTGVTRTVTLTGRRVISPRIETNSCGAISFCTAFNAL